MKLSWAMSWASAWSGTKRLMTAPIRCWYLRTSRSKADLSPRCTRLTRSRSSSFSPKCRLLLAAFGAASLTRPSWRKFLPGPKRPPGPTIFALTAVGVAANDKRSPTVTYGSANVRRPAPRPLENGPPQRRRARAEPGPCRRKGERAQSRGHRRAVGDARAHRAGVAEGRGRALGQGRRHPRRGHQGLRGDRGQGPDRGLDPAGPAGIPAPGGAALPDGGDHPWPEPGRRHR